MPQVRRDGVREGRGRDGTGESLEVRCVTPPYLDSCLSYLSLPFARVKHIPQVTNMLSNRDTVVGCGGNAVENCALLQIWNGDFQYTRFGSSLLNLDRKTKHNISPSFMNSPLAQREWRVHHCTCLQLLPFFTREEGTPLN